MTFLIYTLDIYGLPIVCPSRNSDTTLTLLYQDMTLSPSAQDSLHFLDYCDLH